MASIEATTKMLVMTRHHGAAVNAIYVINKCLTFWIQSNQQKSPSSLASQPFRKQVLNLFHLVQQDSRINTKFINK